MSFKPNYTPGATQPAASQTTTFGAKDVQCKSFKIDIAAGSPFLTATNYTVGYIPKDAQIVFANLVTQTAVSGGTVTGATLAVAGNGGTFISNQSVFAAGVGNMASVGYYTTNVNSDVTVDQPIVYTPTLTGAGATAGIMYINIFYVI